MKITSVKTIRLTYKYKPEEVWGWPGGTYRGWTAGFVRIDTDNGVYGIGEIGDGINVPDVVPLVVEKLSAGLIGESPLAVRKLVHKLYKGVPVWGRRGLGISVISGIESALFDLVGKNLNLPAHVLMGGAIRDKIPTYASGGVAVSPEEIKEEMQHYVRRGFAAVKLRIGFGIEEDVARISAAREVVGSNVKLLLDLGGSYLPESPSVTDVAMLIKELAVFHPYWIEEPLHPDDIEGHARLRSLNLIPIAAGENTRTTHEVKQFLDNDAVDIIQTDAVYAGGMLEQQKIAFMAKQHGVSFAPHTWGSAPGLMANMHAFACMENGLIFEWSQALNPLRELILLQPLQFENGYLFLPELPGLGIDITEELMATYPYDPEGTSVLKTE